MESFILVLASLVLLVPSVLYLPIGMTMKGKMSILFTAIIVTFVGLYASTTIDYWIMLCLLLALIIMITIVIRGRFADMIFSTVEDEEVSTHAELGTIGEQIEAESSVHVIHSHSGKDANVTTELTHQSMADGEPSITEAPQDGDLNRIDIFSVEPELNEEDFVKVLDFEEVDINTIIESDPVHDVGKVDDLLDEDQAAFLNDRESLLENDIDILHEENDIDEKPGYMSDIEKWIEENGSAEDLFTQVEGLEEDINLSEDVTTNQDNLDRQVEQDAMLELENLVEETDDEEMAISHLQYAEDKSVEANSDHAIAIEDDNNLEELYLDGDNTIKQITEQETESENPELRNDTITEEEATVEPEMDMMKADDIDPTISEVVEHTDEANDNSYLQNQMFNIMLDQLYLAKGELTEDEYEKLIRSHLTESLPSSVYYMFSNLLIDHYIAIEKWNELSKILLVLAKKYEQYPVLHEQLEYLYQQYCK